MAHVLATVRARVGQLLARRELEPEDDHTPADPLTETSPVLVGLGSASVQGRIALGPRDGARVRHLGDEPDLGHVTSRARVRPSSTASTSTLTSGSPQQSRPSGATLSVSPPPPLAQDRLRRRPDGRVLIKLKTAVNLRVYHGILAPRARGRSQMVRYGRPAPNGIALTLEATSRLAGPTPAWS